MWANPAVLEEAGIDPAKIPASLDYWIADMQKVAAAGLTPITVGMAWTQLQLLESVLIAELGPDAYNGLFDCKTDWEGPEVAKALDKFATIMDLADKSLLSEDWEPAISPVIEGTAAYNVMGDWAVAAFDAFEKVYKQDCIPFPVPGTDGVFDFLADSFTLPVGAGNVDCAQAWLESISGKDGQVAFNSIKGSIPARSDLGEEEMEAFGEYQQDAMNDAVAKFAQGGSDVAGLQSELAKAAKPMCDK